MGTTMTARFETRREAEMTVERLVQEHGIASTDVAIAAAGRDNTAGEATAGSDARAGEPGTRERHDAALNGAIDVSVRVADESKATAIREAFAEFGARDVEVA